MKSVYEMYESQAYLLNQEFDRLRKIIAHHERKIETLTQERDEALTAKNLYHELCHEWNEPCEDACDSYGHSDACRNVNLAEAKKALHVEIQSLKSALASARKLIERNASQLLVSELLVDQGEDFDGDYEHAYDYFIKASREWLSANGAT